MNRMLRTRVMNSDDCAGRKTFPKPLQLVDAADNVAVEPGKVDRLTRLRCPCCGVTLQYFDWQSSAPLPGNCRQRGVVLQRHVPTPPANSQGSPDRLGCVAVAGSRLE